MSEYHRTQARSNVPDLSGIRSEVRGLRSQNRRLAGELDTSRRNYNQLHRSVSGLRGSIESCRADNRRLESSLGQTQQAVNGLASEQQNLRYRQQSLENNLSRANHNIGRLQEAHQSLTGEVRNVQAEQRQHRAHLQSLDRSIDGLRSDQQELRADLEHQRRETRQELDCLRDYQDYLNGQIGHCQEDIQVLDQVTTDLQRQQNETVEALNEVHRYATEIHRQHQELEQLVEERHQQAMEDLRRQRLRVADARQLAEDNLELLDRDGLIRFGMHADLEEVENLLRQAHGNASDHAMQNAALTLYCSASEKAINLRRRLQDAVRDQVRREQRIRHHLREAAGAIDNWSDHQAITFYRESLLEALRERHGEIENGMGGLEDTTSFRDLTEQTTTLDLEARKLSERAVRCDEQEFPDLVRQVEQRNRFIQAIYQGIVDTFARSGQRAEIRVEPQLTDPENRDSNLRFAAGTDARTAIVEIDLDGNCHFWWEGYPEKTHVQDIEEFESLIRKGRELSFELNSPRSFRGQPEFKDPPPDVLIIEPRRSRPGGRGTGRRTATTKPASAEISRERRR